MRVYVYACGVSKRLSSRTCMAYDVQDDNAKKYLVSAWARFVWVHTDTLT